jgi:gluconokinase
MGPAMAGPVVVMGVAGCGKSTIGTLLAARLGVPYAEADSFHPPANIAKMSKGIALTDEDRQPWLEAIADDIRRDSQQVVSCSALKHQYRDVLRRGNPGTWFLYLVLTQEEATRRVSRRMDHFMAASLVPSQFADLEPLHDEVGLAVDATRTPREIVATALDALPRAAQP